MFSGQTMFSTHAENEAQSSSSHTSGATLPPSQKNVLPQISSRASSYIIKGSLYCTKQLRSPESTSGTKTNGRTSCKHFSLPPPGIFSHALLIKDAIYHSQGFLLNPKGTSSPTALFWANIWEIICTNPFCELL